MRERFFDICSHVSQLSKDQIVQFRGKEERDDGEVVIERSLPLGSAPGLSGPRSDDFATSFNRLTVLRPA